MGTGTDRQPEPACPTMTPETAMRTISSLISGLTVFLAAQAAYAQTDLERATARDAANNGRAAFDAGQYEKAIDSFSRAEQLVHAPPHLLFLARAQVKLGRLVAARESYLKITRETLSAKAPKAFVDAQTAAEQEQGAVDARLPSVTVVLQGAPADGVVVQMDGTTLPAAMIGIPLPADPGQHVFKASGSATGTPVTITLGEAAKQSVTLKLHATAVAPAAPAAGAAPTGAPAASTPASTEPVTVDSSQVKGSGLRIASYVSFGLGAVGLGVGTFFILKSSSTRSESDKIYDDCRTGNPLGKCLDPIKQSQIRSKDSDADSQGKIGVIGLVGGGVGVIAGITFLVLDASSGNKSAHQSTPHVTPVFGFRSLGLVGTF